MNLHPKFLSLLLAILGLAACASSTTAPTPLSSPLPPPEGVPNFVIHPAPTPPKYIPANLLKEFESKIDHPPKPGSAAQKADEAELFELQRKRTADDCVRAANEVRINLRSFMGDSDPLLSDEELRDLQKGFREFLNDADYYIQKIKVDFPRDRPFVYLKGIEPCIAKEVTKSFPSGHAAIARLFARILGELVPSGKKQFLDRADVFGKDRVIGGVHHPSDVRAGKQLGDLIYAKMRKSSEYRKWIKEFSPR